MKVWILGEGDMSGEWEVLGVYVTQEGAQAAAEALSDYHINTGGQMRSSKGWVDITEHDVIACASQEK